MKSFMKFTLLYFQGFDFMDPFVPILVPEFNYKEAHNCIDYYIDRKWINKPKCNVYSTIINTLKDIFWKTVFA